MQTGCITRYRADTGYGFIAPDDGGPDIFLHASALRSMQEKIKDGTAVSYRVQIDPDTGLLSAVNIQLLGKRCKPARRRMETFGRPSRPTSHVEPMPEEPKTSIRVFPPPQKRGSH